MKSEETSADGTTSPTKEIVAIPAKVADPAKVEYKTIDSDDLFVAPNKYNGRGIELRKARCYHADKDDYRCIGAGSLALAVFASDMRPAPEKDGIENDCGELKKMLSSTKCRKTIRFISTKISEDYVNGMQKQVIAKPDYIEIVPDQAKSRK